MGFINEAKYRLTDKNAKTPPFWKKMAKVGGLITATGITFAATVGGGLIIGGIAAAFGVGISVASIFATKDSAADVSVKAEIKKIEKREERKAAKEAEQQSLKTNDK